jgi:hypothetical protein
MKTTLLSAATAVSLALSLTSFACAQASGVAPVTDPNLVNPWGLSRAAGSPWWVSDNGTGLSTLYNGAGAITPLVVTIPKSNPDHLRMESRRWHSPRRRPSIHNCDRQSEPQEWLRLHGSHKRHHQRRSLPLRG